MKQSLSIVIGALNEEKRVGKTLDSLYEFLLAKKILTETEVIVVTADATDRTHEVVAKSIKKFPNHKHLKPGRKIGKGRDIAYGMTRASGELCLFMDADLATPLEYIMIAKAVHSEFPRDVIIGSRELKNIHKGLRSLMSIVGNFVFKVGTGLYVRDTQCGFKAMPRTLAKKIFKNLTIEGWGFDMEVLAMARSAGVVVRELPIPDWVDVEGGTLHGSKFKSSYNTFKELISVSRMYRTGYYQSLLGKKITNK